MNMTSDDVLAELDGLKEVAVLDPVSVQFALMAGKCLMVAVECILDEFDESELPFTRTAILAALLDAAAQMNQGPARPGRYPVGGSRGRFLIRRCSRSERGP